jgi:DNA-binding PadR family transcriptional regulator
MAVLAALAADPSTWRYGYELGQEVGLKAGSLYPILIRLCDRELLAASWESDPPPGRPPRHLYRLTAAGVRLAESAVSEFSAGESSAAPAGSRLRAGGPRSAW